MRLLFIINTTGQAHTWKHVIKNLLNQDHVVKIVAREYGSALAILHHYGLKFEIFKTIGSRYTRLLGALKHFGQCYRLSMLGRTIITPDYFRGKLGSQKQKNDACRFLTDFIHNFPAGVNEI